MQVAPPTSSRATPGPTDPAPAAGVTIGPVRGTAMYVAAVLGPGVLTLPGLAAQQAGPAFLLSLLALLALSAPLAATFAALGRRFPTEGGLAGHVTRAFGARAGRSVAALFYLGVPPGVAALGLFGGGYLQAAVGGKHTALITATALVAVTWALNGGGLRASSTAQVALTGLLLVVVLATVAIAVPHLDRTNFAPVAPHGWAALVPATFLLVWVLTGWEASANLAAAVPPAALRRVVVSAVVIVAVAFLGLSISMVGVVGVAGLGEAPTAQLLKATIGPAAAVVGVGLAVVLTLGNMNAYIASLAALGSTLPSARRLPGGPLTLPTLIALASLAVTSGRHDAETVLVGVTAASQVPVLALALAAGARLLPRGPERFRAHAATVATSALLVPAGRYLIAPALILAGVLARHQATSRIRRRRARRARACSLPPDREHAGPRTAPSERVDDVLERTSRSRPAASTPAAAAPLNAASHDVHRTGHGEITGVEMGHVVSGFGSRSLACRGARR